MVTVSKNGAKMVTLYATPSNAVGNDENRSSGPISS
jgi:hypothetical protein